MSSDALDWDIGEMNKELSESRHMLNEWIDFQEWLIDVYLNNGT